MSKRKAVDQIEPDRAAKSPRQGPAPSQSTSEFLAPSPLTTATIPTIPSAASPPPPTTSSLLSMLRVSPWNPAAIPTARPPLPAITDAEIEASVFRHSSKARQGQQNYEQLEFVGDAYLELFSTELIDHTFGRIITPGRCAQVRELLIRNVTLAEYARAYGLEARIDAAGDVMADRTKQERTKVAADVFEAYVAGIIRSDPAGGLRRAAEWLRDLWALSIQDQLREVGRGDGAGVRNSKALSTGKRSGAKDRLATVVVVPKSVQLQYRDTREPTRDRNKQLLFHVGVYLTGWGEHNKLLGTGSGLSKTEAGERAAEAALQNSKLMKQYESKKAAFMAMKASAAKEEEGEGEGEGEGT